MNKSVALYSYLLNSIDALCASNEEVEEFYEGLSDGEKSKLDQLVQNLENERRVVRGCRHRREIYPNYDTLLSQIDNFYENFQGFPGFDVTRLRYVLHLSKCLFERSSEVKVEPVYNKFSFFHVDLDFPIKAFVTDVSEIRNNLAWLHPGRKDSLDVLFTMNCNVEIIYVLLSIVTEIDFESGKQILVCREDCVNSDNQANVESLLMLHITAAGKEVAKLHEYRNVPSAIAKDEFVPNQNYAQFRDAIYILAEYVNRTDVLSKFLSLYHVIENFMYKRPIVELERSNSGEMFSVRDFRRLFRATEMDEQKALNKLMRSTWEYSLSRTSFGQLVVGYWQCMLIEYHERLPDLDKLFDKLGISLCSTSSLADLRSKYPVLVYKFRNSVVHNKETEYHISSANYQDGSNILLEFLLLPVLEEFVFLLLSKENDQIWYETSELSLWQRSA